MADLKEYKMLKISLGDIPAYVFMMEVRDLEFLTYTAVRGRDNEPGAVQRMLSPVRLRSIEEYILKGNTFYTPFFINWTNNDEEIIENENSITLPMVHASAQVLDGQHRLEGYRRASVKRPEVESTKVVVILTKNLDTIAAASIFLNINTEQKPVPKSLIYDLFGLIHQKDTDIPQVRAKDIALTLQKSEDSPYQNSIKMPGALRGVGLIDLSTIINSIKPFLGEEGAFTRYNIVTLENQSAVIINYFNAIKSAYGKNWYSKSINPFLTNAGFVAAMTVLGKLLIPKCAELKDFTQSKISDLLHIDSNILQRSDIKNQDGKTQRKNIAKYLEDSINRDIPEENAYKF